MWGDANSLKGVFIFDLRPLSRFNSSTERKPLPENVRVKPGESSSVRNGDGVHPALNRNVRSFNSEGELLVLYRVYLSDTRCSSCLGL